MAGRDAGPGGLARDFVGYGRRTPGVHWPGGARLVVNIVVNYEYGAEYSLPDGDGRNDSWGEYSTRSAPRSGTSAPRRTTSSAPASGSGGWPASSTATRCRSRSTRPGVPSSATRPSPSGSPRAGHDVIGHGYRWAEDSEMTHEEERKDLRQAIASIERLTGQRAAAAGTCGRFPSVNTRELLVEEGGFLYDSDASNDELPYFADVKAARRSWWSRTRRSTTTSGT